ncbi:MAG: aminopeptidase [Bdellovibrionales bacterium]|nr:aminopeptidase [Bdellovibrionales bacterium]
MGILKRLILTSIVLIFSTSCAKFNYLYEQGIGQMSLLSTGKDNKEMLKNVRVPKDQKEKIKKVEELKKYFYKYWDKKETKIYSQTTMLKNKAVTYLVIVSPYEEIRAMDNCFPFMGCFPYLGFFNLSSAKAFAKEKETENFVTWTRPVYAYSTLGYFTDTILSSFFEYDEYELAELIFHELYHTIFFVKNEVDLNENLAMYFSERMLEEYFVSINKGEYAKFEEKRNDEHKQVKNLVVTLANELQTLYKSLLPKTREEAETILHEFMEERFKVEVMKKCQALDIQPKDCFPLERNWNNASFAAFLTYEKKSNDLASLQKKLGLDLKGYYNWIAQKYESFQNQNEEEDFETYLFK